MTLVGIISDTHGLLRPQALAALNGSDLILHAGDIGSPAILERLRDIAPVTAVRGNVDTNRWSLHLPLTQSISVAGRVIYMIHDRSQLALHPAPDGVAIVVIRPFPQSCDGDARWRALPQSGQRGASPLPAAGNTCASSDRSGPH